MMIPFNKPFSTGNELKYIRDVINYGHLSGNGLFTKKCQEWPDGAKEGNMRRSKKVPGYYLFLAS